MATVQMITFDRVGCATVPVEVEVSNTKPLQTTSKNIITAGAKKFKTVTKQSRAYHGLTGLELTGSIDLDCLEDAFIVLSGKGGWKGAARLSAAHDSAAAVENGEPPGRPERNGSAVVEPKGAIEKERADKTLPGPIRSASDAEAALPAQGACFPSSRSESSSEADHDPCVIVVHPEGAVPRGDWAATLALYLQSRFNLRARSLPISVRRIGLLDRLDLEHPANVIVPLGRDVTEVAAVRGWNARVCGPEIYSRLDHKGLMTTLEFPHSIPQIPTYVNPPTSSSTQVELSAFKSFVSQFEAVIFKPTDSAGSKGQSILSRKQLEDLFQQSATEPWPLDLADTVAQPHLKNHTTVEFNFFALDGELIEWLCTYASGGITEDMWANGTSLTTYDGDDLNRMVLFVRDTVRMHKLHGLMEFEFLIAGDQLFFLEVNPRISSSVTGFDSNGFSPYIEKLVVPCLQSFGLLAAEEISNWQAPCVTCPPEGRAKDFWERTHRETFTRRRADGQTGAP